MEIGRSLKTHVFPMSSRLSSSPLRLPRSSFRSSASDSSSPSLGREATRCPRPMPTSLAVEGAVGGEGGLGSGSGDLGTWQCE